MCQGCSPQARSTTTASWCSGTCVTRPDLARLDRLLEFLELIPQIFGGLIPMLGVFDQTVLDDSAQVQREARIEVGHGGRRVLHDRGQNRQACVTLERTLSCDQLVQDD